MAKLSNDELIAAFKEMTLIELSDFVKLFEETFDVEAAAPAAVAVAAPAADAPAAAHGHRSLALMFRCITKFSDTVVMCTRASYPWLVLLFRMWPPT